MVNPQFVEMKAVSLSEVKDILQEIEKKDNELNTLSNKTKDYLEQFDSHLTIKKDALSKKLNSLEITRLKEEQIAKIIDFMPNNLNDLKIVLLSYPNLSLSKKDQESIVEVIKEFTK